MFRPSASGLERALVCQASCIIPVRASNEDPESNKVVAALRGTSIHEHNDRVLHGMSVEESLKQCPEEHRAICARVRLPVTDLDRVQTEASFAIDFATGITRYLGSHLNRNYPTLEQAEYSGTLDIMGLNKSSGIPYVADLKSGMLHTDCQNNAQLKFAALAASKFFSFSVVDASLIYLREDEDPYVDSHTFTQNELLRIEEEFSYFHKELMRQYVEWEMYRKLDMKEGLHCMYCPAAIGCPAKQNALFALVQKAERTDLSTLADNIASMTPEQATQAWLNYKQVHSYWEIAERAIKDYGKRHGIDLPDGRRVVAVESSKTVSDTDTLLKIARSRPLTEHDFVATIKRVRYKKLLPVKIKSEK